MLETVLQNSDLRHGAEKFFVLTLSRDGMGEYFAHERQPCNQIVRPGASSAKSCESNGADNAPTNAKWDAKMRMHSRPSEIFRLADRFRRQIFDRALHSEHFASPESSNKPGKLCRKGTRWCRLDSLDGG